MIRGISGVLKTIWQKEEACQKLECLKTPQEPERHLFYVLSHAGEREVADKSLSEPQGDWSKPQTQKPKVEIV